ncbi:MAG: class I SAM-dependent methyltransferase [Cyclobacteriaceae bacterium]
MEKSTIEEIRERFDQDVDRFSNLATGQTSTIDAALSLELITEAASKIKPKASHLLDIGCGAGNYTLKMLSKSPGLHCTLNDLSLPMLERAEQRISQAQSASVSIIHGDMREVEINEQFDIILAGAVLHHLRDDEDWESMFARLFELLKPGGCLWISDLIAQEIPVLHEYTWERYGQYLEGLGGSEYRQKVLNYVDFEDSPRPMTYQLELMRKVGFSKVEILHKNVCFGAFGGVK